MQKRLSQSLCLLFAFVWTVNNAWAQSIQQDEADGYYMIYTAEDLEEFSVMARDKGGVSGKLMNDIDMTGIVHIPIGVDPAHKFRNGQFDGQGFRIKNMTQYSQQEPVGLFGAVRGGTQIRNVIIDSTCVITGANWVGGIAGSVEVNGGANPIFENCGNEGKVVATGNHVGGILGGSRYNDAGAVLKSCYNTGTVTGGSRVAGLVGNFAGQVASLTNCYNAGIIESSENFGFTLCNADNDLTRVTLTNCYDVSQNTDRIQGILDMTEQDILGGKFCYLLGEPFTQNLGVDPLPVFGHNKVYLNGNLLCDGTPLDGTYSNTETTPVQPPHTYSDGEFYCSVCGKISEDFCQEVDGYYQLARPIDLCWFAALVNSGKTTSNAVLMSDLDMLEYSTLFEPIGTESNLYQGHFDGQYHTISNLVVDRLMKNVGMFGTVSGGTTIENLILDATCEIVGDANVGLVGCSRQSGPLVLRNLGFLGTVTSRAMGAGAILGVNNGSAAAVDMQNCFSMGFVFATGNENGAISGWLGSNSPKVTNCWTTTQCDNTQSDDRYIGRHENGSFTNCYSIRGTQGSPITEDDVFLGKLAYKLNGDQSQIIWFQNIDNGQPTDEYPTFLPGHGQVYPVGTMLCDGTFDFDEVTWSNTNSAVIPPHEYVDGFCKKCGNEDPDYPNFLKVIENADYDNGTTGWLQEEGSGNMPVNNSVAEHWDQQFFDSYQIIDSLKPGVYKIRVQGYQRASQFEYEDYYTEGVLNPIYHKDHHTSVYYAESNGKRVASLFMDIAEGKQSKRMTEKEVESYNEVTGCWVPNSMASGRVYFSKGNYWNTPLYVAVTDSTLRIGVRNYMHAYGNWTVWDTWRLEYVGDDEAAYNLVRAQQMADVQDLDGYDAQTSLMEAYEKAQMELPSAATPEEIMQATDVIARHPEYIRKSHFAYIKYNNAVQEVIAERANHELFGPDTDILDTYLEESQPADENYPNGTYDYIMNEKLVSVEELEAEIQFVQQLLYNAIKNSVSEGSDITNLIVNPGFDQDANFYGWTTQVLRHGSSYNLSSNKGYTDIYPVSGSWNAAFNVEQQLESGLPNGIYMLEAPALYRPGVVGEGSEDGSDLVPTELFINDYYTPVMNIFAGYIPYDEAVNGVNCRFDASTDPTAPHNGENVDCEDYATSNGYIPGNDRFGTSFAFSAGRYVSRTYAVVTDGNLRVGIRNTGNPWYNDGTAMWGKMKLVYLGQSEQAVSDAFQTYAERVQNIRNAQSLQDYFISISHLDTIEQLLAQGEGASLDEKIALMQQINAEFNAIYTSRTIYTQLFDLSVYLQESTGDLDPDDPKVEMLWNISDEILEHVFSGDLTDTEAQEYYYSLVVRPELGAGVYIQGDLVDESAENGNWDYAQFCTLYPMTMTEPGKWTGTVKVQNRTNRANANARAGVYFMYMGKAYKAPDARRRFVTPANNEFAVQEGGNDFHMNGGVFDVTLDLTNGTVTFDAKEYYWSNNVFAVGTLNDHEGNDHRYKNDEAVPLKHQGEGLYAGKITLFEDYKNLGAASFCIFTCRSTEEDVQYSTVGRSDWFESRVSSDPSRTDITNGEVFGDLIRGNDYSWIVVDSEYGDYWVKFDMNRNTIQIERYADQDANGIDNVEVPELVRKGIYTLNGVRLQKVSRPGLYIIDGRKVMVK